MHEVEIKAAIKDREAVLEKLRSLGCEFEDAVTQEDVIYVQKIGSIPEFLSNPIFCRVRVNNGEKIIFTLKYDPERQGDPHTTPLEHEVTVSSKEEIESILALLGFKEAVRLIKKRCKGNYDKWELCLDEVEGLGSFIEVEELVPPHTDMKAVQDEMLAFLGTLGIEKKDMFAKRYDIAFLEKQNHEQQ